MACAVAELGSDDTERGDTTTARSAPCNAAVPVIAVFSLGPVSGRTGCTGFTVVGTETVILVRSLSFAIGSSLPLFLLTLWAAPHESMARANCFCSSSLMAARISSSLAVKSLTAICSRPQIIILSIKRRQRSVCAGTKIPVASASLTAFSKSSEVMSVPSLSAKSCSQMCSKPSQTCCACSGLTAGVA